MSAAPILGGCLCGEVRFRVEPPTKWCAHCHCTMCRRAHGAGFVTWLGAFSERFSVERGEGGALVWYESSPGAERGFCAHCGSSLFFRSSRWPGEMHVALGCVDGPIDRKPSAHVFTATHVEWIAVDDALPRFIEDGASANA